MLPVSQDHGWGKKESELSGHRFEDQRYIFSKSFFHVVSTWKGCLTSPELRYFGVFCLRVFEYSVKEFGRRMKQMEMPRWTRYGNCQPRTMRLSVEPLCPTHNVQRRREPVYNSSNPRHKNKDGYFPAWNLLFQACSSLLQSFCQSGSVECFPSSHGYMYFPPNPSYYSLVCNIEKPRWMLHKITTDFFSLLFYLLIHPKQRVSTNRRQVTVVVTISCICGLKRRVSHFTCQKESRWGAEVSATPSVSARWKARGGNVRPKTESVLFSQVLEWLLQWSEGHWIPDLCLLHVKVSLSKMSNPIRAREAVLLVHEWLFLNPDWLLCH